jgi:PAS domain S-box-containing protein
MRTLADPQTGASVAMLGRDRGVLTWNGDAVSRAALPEGLILVLLVLLVAGMIAFRSRVGASVKPIQRRLMIPLAAVLLLLTAGFGALLLKQQQDTLNQASQTAREDVSGDLALMLAEQARTLDARGQVLLQEGNLRTALKARDRERLLTDYGPAFATLQADHGATHFYLLAPDRVCLLRVHQPADYGDRIDRFTLREAERTGKAASGLELGPLGTVTLRSVQPVYDGGALVGYLELGKEIEHLLTTLHDLADVEIALAVHKGALDRSAWEAGMKKLGRTSDWDRFPAAVLVYSSLPHPPAAVERFVGEQGRAHGDVDAEIAFGGQSWRGMTLPLKDVSGIEIGNLILLKNFTAMKAAQNRLLMAGAGGALALLAGLFGFLLVLLRRTDRGIMMQQESLRASEASFRSLLEAAPEGIFVQSEGRFTFLNPAMLRLLGATRPEDLLGTEFIERLSPEYHDAVRGRIRAQQATGKPSPLMDQKYVRLDGTRIPVETTAVALRFQGRDAHLVFVRDITERKRAAAENERLLAAIEQSGETIVITDPEGIIQYVNPAFVQGTGYSRDEAVGQRPRIIKSGLHDETFYRGLWQTVAGGKTWKGRFINKRKEGTLYTEEATISPVRDGSGAIVNYVAVKRDITEHLHLSAQLQQAQKMESIGRLAGGVAHDFNNMLGVILGTTELALIGVDPSEPIFGDLQEVRNAAERSADLTRQLLAFARKQTVAPKVIDLNDTVTGMLKMLRRLIGEDIDLDWQPGPNLWPIEVDPSQIDQVLANLSVNVRDAVTGAGKLTLETRNMTVDEAYGSGHMEAVPGEYVLLAVSDNGGGMDKEVLRHLFEPFFTTKEVGAGTGLGLSMVYGIVKQNRGFINVYSELGQGTTFKICLPRYKGQSGPLQPHGTIEPARRGTEAVLLVEDEPAILKMSKLMLENLGYRVLSATTPAEAIGLAEKHAGCFHLLLTDVVMPGMNGEGLAKRLQDLDPKLKCLFMSGYTANVIARQGVLYEGVNFIQKPFSMRALATQLREALDGP